MTKMFYEEYKDNLDIVRSTLLEYYLEFEQLKLQAEKDFSKGLLTIEEYEVIKKYRIDEYYTDKHGKKSRYCLSKKKIEIIKKYAELDEKGNLMLDSLKEKYKRNSQVLSNIFESIRIFYYYTSLSEEELRSVITAVVCDYYDNAIHRLEAAIECGATSLTIDNDTIDARFLPAKIRNLELHKKGALDRIRTSSYENILDFIAKFNNIDFAYYNWFRIKTMQNDARNPEIYENHQRRVENIKLRHEALLEEQNGIEAKEKDVVDAKSAEKAFNEKVEQLNNNTTKKPLLRRIIDKIGIKTKNNRDELRVIFNEFTSLPDFNLYIATLDNYNIKDTFEIFMSNKYPMINYVDEASFKEQLINSLSEFYKKRVEDASAKLTSTKKRIAEEKEALKIEASSAIQESEYITEISKSLKIRTYLPDLDDEEQERIFNDMQNYFQTKYQEDVLTFTEKRNIDDISNSKRGNK